jgi:hypothetical protein
MYIKKGHNTNSKGRQFQNCYKKTDSYGFKTLWGKS